MSYQEKMNLVGLVSLVVTSVVYALIIFQKYQIAGLDATNDFRFWGVAMVVLLPVLFLSQLVAYLLLVVFNAVVKKEKAVDIEDELDKVIDLKATQVSFYVFSLGVIASMGLLIINQPPRAVFIAIAVFLVMSSIMGFLTKLVLYRRGV